MNWHPAALWRRILGARVLAIRSKTSTKEVTILTLKNRWTRKIDEVMFLVQRPESETHPAQLLEELGKWYRSGGFRFDIFLEDEVSFGPSD